MIPPTLAAIANTDSAHHHRPATGLNKSSRGVFWYNQTFLGIPEAVIDETQHDDHPGILARKLTARQTPDAVVLPRVTGNHARLANGLQFSNSFFDRKDAQAPAHCRAAVTSFICSGFPIAGALASSDRGPSLTSDSGLKPAFLTEQAHRRACARITQRGEYQYDGARDHFILATADLRNGARSLLFAHH